MSNLENAVQGLVHNLEQGGLARWIRFGALLVGVFAISLMYLFWEFKGLSEPMAMEQAQISREIAKGNGFSTHSIRPLAIWQLAAASKEVPRVNFPDTYHAPLNPYVNAIPMLAAKRWWVMETDQIVGHADQVIAGVQMSFFLLSLVVWYAIGRRLFDTKLSLLGVGLLLVCDHFWKFSLSGLPQMLMLLLFSGAMYCLLRAIEGSQEQRRVGFWLSAMGVLFGLLALTHALVIWIFAGLVIFVAVFFKPRVLAAVLVLGFFLIVYSPWLVRNQMVTGSPFGLGIYSVLDGAKMTEIGWMRQSSFELKDVPIRNFRKKLETNFTSQIDRFYQLLGAGVAAPAFFLSLLHPFRRREAFHLRWAILLMWAGGFIGMTLFGIGESEVGPNQLHVLFIPLMTLYGLAFLLVLWSRLSIDYRFLRICFLVVIYLISAVGMMVTLVPERTVKLNWPPYVPPYIAILAKWTQPQEVLSSDMAWAVGWYADRKCVWLPAKVQEFVQLSDYERLGGPIVGMYLTPITGNAKLMAEVVKGEYKEWAPFVMRSPNLKDFPLKTGIPLPLDNECLYLSDRERWGAAAE